MRWPKAVVLGLLVVATVGCQEPRSFITVHTEDGSRFIYADTPEARADLEKAVNHGSEWVVLPHPSSREPCRIRVSRISAITLDK